MLYHAPIATIQYYYCNDMSIHLHLSYYFNYRQNTDLQLEIHFVGRSIVLHQLQTDDRDEEDTCSHQDIAESANVRSAEGL